MWRESDLIKTIENIYTSIASPEPLSSVLNAAVSSMNAMSAGLIVNHIPTGKIDVVASHNPNPEALREYERYYRNLDVLAKTSHKTLNMIAQSDELIRMDQSLYCKEYEEDFIGPYSIYTRAAFSFKINDQNIVTFAVQLGKNKPFSDSAMMFLKRIAPHVRQAMLLHSKLSEQSAVTKVLSSGFESLGVGVILLTSEGHPLLVNNTANDILKRYPLLRISGAGLTAANSEQTQQLQKLIHHAKGANPRMGAVKLQSETETLDVQVFPLNIQHDNLMYVQASVAVLILDPRGFKAQSPEPLIKLYGLTKIEASLCLDLVQGLSIKEIADKRCKSTATLNNQVASIFGKMGVRNRAALMHKLFVPAVFSGVG